VHGDLLRVEQERVLTSLDAYEECHGDDPLYVRREVLATRPDGGVVRAWAYVYLRPIGSAPLVPGGDYAMKDRTAGLLDKRRTIAGPGFNRWLVPPAALCLHLCIGMAYGFSVFWLPLTRAVGITTSVNCPADMGFLGRLTATTCDWDKPLLGWIYTLFFVFLGSSAAAFGPWLERVGPRRAGVVAAACWCGGLVLAAGGVAWHQLWVVWLGAGVIGGIGLGIGYISPVSTLIRWFPDRRGLATGMAIMGFGGGAMIGAPLAQLLMGHFAGPRSVGVWETLLVLAVIYFGFMMLGAFAYRVPPEGWSPGSVGAAGIAGGPPPHRSFTAGEATRTRQFWLLWAVLCLNVSAGIGVIGMASPMLQEMFGGRLVGRNLPYEQLDAAAAAEVAAVAAGFTGLLSLFNILGRFFWSALSDRIGRRGVYTIFFAAGLVLYASVPVIGRSGNVPLFCGCFCLILSMYGGGFAAIPAYLADLFGTANVGAIHGRLLTAWSVAGILGPVLVNYVNQWQLDAGMPPARAYDRTMLLLAGLLAAGLAANLAIRPVRSPTASTAQPAAHPACAAAGSDARWPLVVVFWLVVMLPLTWGTLQTLRQAAALFRLAP
jgi:MFS family permease